MRNSNHVVANLLFLSDSLCAQAHNDKCGTNLAFFSTPVFFHGRSRRGNLRPGVAHDPSLSANASLSRIAISSGTRGDRSILASASLRCANVIPRSSSASIRSNSTLTTGPIVATSGPFRAGGHCPCGNPGGCAPSLSEGDGATSPNDFLSPCGTRLPERCTAAGFEGLSTLSDLLPEIAPLDADAAARMLRGEW